ncbi:MAG: asparagine synthase (glutamine-hydrolyzing) [Thalassospira sp.]|uniref:asparagine synthase (glutamine-hydrolyzing) n=1 Tax=Thalassospira sp. TaxID=1912094 RepID=UPI001B2980C1|nr:asparagine synthase (glutamine-hydrolyzing) [Thalassospira sp.]MBO6580881.1 asparagine synthase (glutamine-hydrolyzing) [Thalassospira sp.]MBO6802954.1 asparagine synthase (glutamine-hydrolyzing) [Thalassospira sp.]MBO6816944.1 asparagine synthase (glutamine-hydrolyzing) [Thalassospira sp.]MBO6886928.1 asparagine synthase (glutamine-hydrolyzing) [Thalassospira sp.]
MCGISGSTQPENHSAVDAMLQRLAHRGPDGSGVWSDPNGKIALGCVRLATTDLTGQANQPLISTDGRFVLVFNGYIAGHRCRIQAATRDGLAFQTRNDAELVLQLMSGAIRQGNDPAQVLQTLSGQYALALWDVAQSCLWLARDPLGIKPLYVLSRPEGHIAFASEISAFSAISPLVRDERVKSTYLAHLFVPAPNTGKEAIKLLPPGTLMRWQAGEVSTGHIAHPAYRADKALQMPTAGGLLSAVRQSVADAMDADCEFGCLVSGGLDSAGVAALACDIARERGQSIPKAFVMGFDDPAIDETEAAQKLCRHLGQELHVVAAPTQPEDIYQELVAALRSVGGPFANPSIVLMRCLAKAVSRDVKVCLSGDGGDELFGGYPRYRAAQLYETYWRHVPRPIRRLTAKLYGADSRREFHRFLAGGSGARNHAFAFWNNRCVMPECDARIAQHPDIGGSLTDAMMHFDRDVTLPGNQLLMSDRCGMAHGLEYRLPLLGHDVVRIAAAVPAKQHLKYGPKPLWRQAITPYLPAGHVQHHKIGFNPPVATWLLGVARYLWGDENRILEAIFADVAITQGHKTAYWKRAVSGKDLDMALSVWALMVWQIWLELDGSDMGCAADTA